MRQVGETPWTFRASNVCQCKGRTLGFFRSNSGKLVVCEALLGDRAAFPRAFTDVDVGTGQDSGIACCSAGDWALVMFGSGEKVSAFSITLGKGALSSKIVTAQQLLPQGVASWGEGPRLCQSAAGEFVLGFEGGEKLWAAKQVSARLLFKEVSGALPGDSGLGNLPLPLGGGRVLLTGADGASPCLFACSVGAQLECEDLGIIPGDRRTGISLAALGKRFVVGFGGSDSWPSSALWVYDLQEGTFSPADREGDWHEGGADVPLAVAGGALYLLGGAVTRSVWSISLRDLAGRLTDREVQKSFCSAFQIPVPAERRGPRTTGSANAPIF